MAAIGSDILDIGTSKWSESFSNSNVFGNFSSSSNPGQFMLPAAENVSYMSSTRRVADIKYAFVLFLKFSAIGVRSGQLQRGEGKRL